MKVKYLQIYTKKEYLLEAWKKIKERYGFSDNELKNLVFEVIQELAENESFYKTYLEKMKEKIRKGEAVSPTKLLVDIMFNKQ